MNKIKNDDNYLCAVPFCDKIATHDTDVDYEIYCEHHASLKEDEAREEAERQLSKSEWRDVEGDIRYHEDLGA